MIHIIWNIWSEHQDKKKLKWRGNAPQHFNSNDKKILCDSKIPLDVFGVRSALLINK